MTEKTYMEDFLEKFPNAKMIKDVYGKEEPAVCREDIYGIPCPAPDDAPEDYVDTGCAECWREVIK